MTCLLTWFVSEASLIQTSCPEWFIPDILCPHWHVTELQDEKERNGYSDSKRPGTAQEKHCKKQNLFLRFVNAFWLKRAQILTLHLLFSVSPVPDKFCWSNPLLDADKQLEILFRAGKGDIIHLSARFGLLQWHWFSSLRPYLRPSWSSWIGMDL